MLIGGAAALAAVGVLAVVLSIASPPADPEQTAAPDFELVNLEGETVRLSDYRGRPVALTFMHTW